jgi:BMFP domain-containing protein YqiC
MAKAPEKVVADTRRRLETAEADITRLEARLASLPAA